jgi:hypothetical protein
VSELKRFWMVYGVDQRAPAVQHSSEAVAIAEAQRLARNNPDVEFYVLESVARAVKADVVFERIERPDPIPF